MAIRTETFRSKRSDVPAYIDEIRAAMALLRDEEIEAGVTLPAWTRQAGHAVTIFGNGGSAATASQPKPAPRPALSGLSAPESPRKILHHA